jgi:iron complex transport system substrate-binding protein
VIASEHSKPKMVLDSLKTFGINTQLISDKPTMDSVYEKITHIGNVLHEDQKAQELFTKLKTNITAMQDEIKLQKEKPKVLILFSQGENTLMAAGKTTKAGAMIEIAGGINGVNIDSFASISQESILAMNPDVVIFTNHNGVSSINHSLIKMTNAEKNHRVYDMDMLLLSGFSTRSDEALKQLSCALYTKHLSYCER